MSPQGRPTALGSHQPSYGGAGAVGSVSGAREVVGFVVFNNGVEVVVDVWRGDEEVVICCVRVVEAAIRLSEASTEQATGYRNRRRNMVHCQPASDLGLLRNLGSEDDLRIVGQILFGADVMAMVIDSHPTFILRR